VLGVSYIHDSWLGPVNLTIGSFLCGCFCRHLARPRSLSRERRLVEGDLAGTARKGTNNALKPRVNSPSAYSRHRSSHLLHPTATLTRNRASGHAITCKLPAHSRNHERRLDIMATTHWATDELPASPKASLLSNHGSEQPYQSRTAGATRTADTPKLQSDTTSDRATAAFVRRTLCSHNVLLGNGERGRTTPRPIEEVLPPLTSSNEVDLQLYGIISVIIKEFVQTWYSKITPDHIFVNEVLQIIAHCTRGLEQRLRKVDLEAMLLDEIPELLEAHLKCRCLQPLNFIVILI
jgi:hypothetical protein